MENSRLSIASLGWGTISGIVASLSVLISVTYDWGYFFELGLSLSKSPITISDHVQSWVAWLPVFFSAGVGVFLAQLISIENPVKDLSGNATDEQLHDAKRALRKIRFKFTILLLISSILIMTIYYAQHDSIYPFGFIFLPLLWIFLFNRVQGKFPVALGKFLTLIPLVIAYSFLSGSIHASHALGKQGQLTHRIVVVDNGESQRVSDIKVLRVFQDWFLIVENDEQIVWISSKTVERMEVLNES